mmetsp:Transcript_126732/g.405172  ORF Transcript_126732/g.405172 Transcript_126732/m.405172 type:complete len:1155 (+) Transcript_126732:57-3521(+)
MVLGSRQPKSARNAGERVVLPKVPIGGSCTIANWSSPDAPMSARPAASAAYKAMLKAPMSARPAASAKEVGGRAIRRDKFSSDALWGGDFGPEVGDGQVQEFSPLPENPPLGAMASQTSLFSGSVGGRSRAESQRHFDMTLREVYGCSLEKLRIGDVHRNLGLRNELARLPLNEYFDGRGVPRFSRLGLSFAANQHEDVKGTFGNWVDDPDVEDSGEKKQSAKSYFLATEAIEKDADYRATRKGKILESLNEQQKCKVEDVQRRQLEVLFSEVPDFELHFPPGIYDFLLLPLEISKEDERANRTHVDKTSSYLMDRLWRAGGRSDRMMTRGEVLFLSLVSNLWMKSSHGNSSGLYLGFDRPTFCRLILDLGLVDQDTVPYFWAVSLFDEAARIVRCCGRDTEMAMAHLSPILPIVSRWALIGVLDQILRLHFTNHTKSKFFASLLPLAKLRLPAHVIQESCLQEDMVLEYLGNPDMLVTGGPNGEGGPEGFGVKGPVSAEEKEKEREREQRGHGARLTKTSAEDMAREQVCREFYVRAMIVEPEVLHLLAQHQSMFQKLHECYAEDGDLTYLGLLQFCTDFHLTPSIASGNFVKLVFESTATVEHRRAGHKSEVEEVSDKLSRSISMFPTALASRPSQRGAPEGSPRGTSPSGSEATNGERGRMTSVAGSARRPSNAGEVDGGTSSPSHKEDLRGSRRLSKRDSTVSALKTLKMPRNVDPLGRRASDAGATAISRTKTESNDVEAAVDFVPDRPEDAERWPPAALPWQGLAELAARATRVDKALRVQIQSARNLHHKGDSDRWSDKLDTFVTCMIKTRDGPSIHTKVARDTMEPEWHFDGRFAKYPSGAALEFEFRSKDSKEVLARGTLPADKFQKEGFSGELQLESTTKNVSAMFLSVKVKVSAADFSKTMRGAAPSTFGVGAFMEALCHIAFAYLGAYGNTQQQNSCGLARTVWLLTYMRSVFVHLRRSAEKRGKGAPGEGLHEPLRKALSHETSDLWAFPLEASAVFGEAPRPAPTMRPGLPDDPTGEVKRKRLQTKASKKEPDAAAAEEAARACRVRRMNKRNTTGGSGPSMSTPGTPLSSAMGSMTPCTTTDDLRLGLAGRGSSPIWASEAGAGAAAQTKKRGLGPARAASAAAGGRRGCRLVPRWQWL